MGHHCSDHSEHHHHGETCGCGCGCGSHHGHGNGDGCDCIDKFFELADEAWREVLLEKIKVQIITHKGDQMDKLAEMIAKANGAKWKSKLYGKSAKIKFKDELKEYFTSHE